MAQTSLNSTGVASSGALSLQSNGTTEAIGISTGQVATLAQNPILTSGTANGVAYLNGSKVLTTGSALVFDGTQLGIGASPTYPLLVKKAASSSDNSTISVVSGTAGYAQILLGDTVSDAVGYVAYNNSANSLEFATNGSERMRLDSSGNLGLGVTPSAWDSGYQVLQNTGGALWSGSSTTVRLTQNTYFATSFKYVGNTFASQYVQTSGQHQWFNAPSGTAGNAITFTQAMTLDASGNLLVGTTAKPTTNFYGLSVKSSTSSASDWGFWAENSSSNAALRVRNDGYVNSLSTYSLTGGTANLSIDSSGYITRATSSIRYKRDVETYDKGLSTVLAARPVYYKSSVADANGNVPETQFAGLIAEELDALGLNEFVEYNQEGQPDAVRYGNMVSLCIKAIQEQQAIITQLTTRITALEGN